MPMHTADSDPPVVAVRCQAAPVATAPKRAVRSGGGLLQLPKCLVRGLRQDGPERGQVGSPESQAVGAAGAQSEVAVEDDQVTAAGGPAATPADRDGVKVDEGERRLLVVSPADEDVAWMEVVMEHARGVQSGDKFPERTRDASPTSS